MQHERPNIWIRLCLLPSSLLAASPALAQDPSPELEEATIEVETTAERLSVGEVVLEYAPPADQLRLSEVVLEYDVLQPPPDTTPPDTSILSAVDGDGNPVSTGGSTPSTAIVIAFTGSDDVAVVAFECSLDGAPFAPCSSPDTLSNLSVGVHTFTVRAKDAAGNVDPTPAALSWTITTGACVPPPDGLAHWWMAEGNANDDMVASPGSGIMYNGATFAPGRVGQAFRLDGVDDYVSTPTAGPAGGNARTISVWMNTSSLGAAQTILSYGTQAPGKGFSFTVENGSIGLHIGGADVAYSAGQVNDGLWHQLALVIPSAARLQDVIFYMDGVRLGALLSSSNPGALLDTGTDNPVHIGVSSFTLTGYFNGLIDETAFFDRALTPSEIQTLFAAGAAGMCCDMSVAASEMPPAVTGVPYNVQLTVAHGSADTWALIYGTLPGGLTLSPSGVISGVPTGGGGGQTFVVDVNGGVAQRSLTIIETPIRFCTPPPSNLVGWWQADGNAADAAGSNAGMLQNGVTFTDGKVGLAFRFASPDDAVVVPDSPSLHFGTGSFSVDLWARLDELGGTSAMIAGKRSVGPGGSGWWLGRNGTTGRWSVELITDGRTFVVQSDAPAVAGRFVHLAFVVDRPADALKLYVDGTLQSSQRGISGLGTPDCVDPLLIGGTPAQPLRGLVDEIEIFGRALSYIEIQTVFGADGGKCGMPFITPLELPGGTLGTPYSAPFEVAHSGPGTWSVVSGVLPPGLTLGTDGVLHGTPTGGGAFDFTVEFIDSAGRVGRRKCFLLITPIPCCIPPRPGLVSWWPANGDAKDPVSGNDATLIGGTTYTTGRTGQAFAFDGINDAVEVPHNANLNPATGDFTVAFWMRSSSSGVVRAILNKRASCGDGSHWDIRLNSDGRLFVELDQDASGTNRNSLSSLQTVNDDQWHHVALVRGATTARLYVDTGLSASRSTPSITDIANTAPLRMGGDPCIGIDGTTFYRGSLDEVEFYGRALSSSEIQALFFAGDAGKCGQAPSAPGVVCVGESFRDDFSDGIVDSTWHFTANGGGGTISESSNPGFLRINHPAQVSNPFVDFLQNVPFVYRTVTGDFEITVKGTPLAGWSPDFKEFGILAEINETNYLVLVNDWSNTLGSRIVRYEKKNGIRNGTNTSIAPGTQTMYLRLSRSDGVFRTSYSPDGSTWTELAAPCDDIRSESPLKLGMAVISARGQAWSAGFDFFDLKTSCPLAGADTLPPDTLITSAVDGVGTPVPSGGLTSSPAISIAFSGTDNLAVAGFEASLDGAAFAPVFSPASFTNLGSGPHTFQVRALDAANNVDPTPASFTWTVVTTAAVLDSVINAANLPQGTIAALSSKVEAAANSYASGQNNAGNNQLQAFINYVKAQSGKSIPVSLANMYVAAATAIIQRHP